jgi:trehalose-6-phosphate synthase
VLSRTAGAFEQLAEVALPVTPTDIDETATELYEALSMSLRERAQRSERAREIVDRETPLDWVFSQVRDAVTLRRASSRQRSPRTKQPLREAPVA